jgi:hypothetical protein
MLHSEIVEARIGQEEVVKLKLTIPTLKQSQSTKITSTLVPLICGETFIHKVIKSGQLPPVRVMFRITSMSPLSPRLKGICYGLMGTGIAAIVVD